MISTSTMRRPRQQFSATGETARGKACFWRQTTPPAEPPVRGSESPDHELIERIKWIQRRVVAYVFHPDFDDQRCRGELLEEPAPTGAAVERAPQGASSYVAILYSTPLLNREEEAGLFRRMNGLKHLAAEIQDRLDPDCPDREDVTEFEGLMGRACRTRNLIVQSNLRLVFSLAKRFAGTDQEEFGECVAEGNMALMRAVEHFDFSRGHRFSTYAHHAIRRQLLQRVQAEVRRRERFVTGGEEAAEGLDRDEGRAIRDALRSGLAKQAILDLLPCLSERERAVIEVRFGLGEHARQTFEEIGRQMGVSKERVRQLQARALRKMARSASQNQLARAWEEASSSP